MIKPTNYHIKPNILNKFATNMTKPGVYLPIILLETTVVAGRTYQAYKRGGVTEARERVIEESTGSFVWLGGAPLLFKFGNVIGEKLMGIKNTNFDIGKDSLRNPFENVIKSIKGASKGKYAGFKFANTILSVAIASGFLGFVVPKLNQKLTKKLHKTNTKQQSENTIKTQQPIKRQISMEEFLAKSNKEAKGVNFKGLINADTIATLTHKIGNDAVYKLATTDTGVISGRAYNARNKDERREILFRDIASTFFYLGAASCVHGGLKAVDNKILPGNTNIDAYSAMNIHNHLLDTVMKSNAKMSVKDFEQGVLGTFDKKLFDTLKFDADGIITLDKFKEAVTNSQIREKAAKMATMQPMKDGVSVLTKQQAQAVLTDGQVYNPEFMKKVLNGIFGKLDGSDKVLDNPHKFIARKDIEKSAKHIEDYAKSIIEYAKKHNISEITPEMMQKVYKRNLYHRTAFMAAGFGVAALFLSTIIPKVQYWITKLKTGSDEFPAEKSIDK